MTTNPPEHPPEPSPEHPPEPSDLSQLAATDALLDRLAARNASADDLTDPAAAGLVELIAAIDDIPEPDFGLSRLIEVLGDRPLYLNLHEKQEGELAADLLPAGPDRVIDLTEHGTSIVEILDGDAQLVGARRRDVDRAVRAADADGADGAHKVVALLPRQTPGARWTRVVSQAALPAASVVALLVLGGGVSAAVTGNPMAAVNSVTSLVSQLPGVGRPSSSVQQVQGEISAASTAVQRHDKSAATMHLDAARRGLSDVPDETKPQLNQLIATLQTQLGLPGANGSPTPAPTVSTAAPVAGQDTPPPSPAPSDPATDPAPDPTASDAPSPEPTSAPVDTSQPESSADPGDPTPVDSPSDP